MQNLAAPSSIAALVPSVDAPTGGFTAPVHKTRSQRPPLAPDERMAFFTSLPYIAVHLGCLSAIGLGAHASDVALCIGLYYLRMFGITAGYHRYFAHRSYKTSRAFQFLMALIGTLALQKGVLWWAAHHRSHHKHSDDEKDVHSPVQRGLYWAHQGWILCAKYDQTDWAKIQDFAKYPELRWLNKYFLVPPLVGGVILYLLGGWHWFVWGGLISTVLLWHGTFTINSLSHVWGRRRYQTSDDSRNNFFLALLTMGEGWHNNHHHYQSTANQGFFWWEIDASFYLLKVLSWLGIVWDLRKPPPHILQNSIASSLAAASAAILPKPVPREEAPALAAKVQAA